MKRQTSLYRKFYFSVCLLAGASSYSYADLNNARNAAMGGAGVASSEYDAAALYNAALLTKKDESDSVSVILPSIGVLASDKDEIIDTLDDLTDEFDLLESQLDGLAPDISGATATKNRIVDDLRFISDKPVTVNVGVAPLVVAIPGDEMGFALSISGEADVAVLASFDAGDEARLQDAIDDLNPDLDAADLRSSVKAVGAVIAEVGLSFAKRYNFAGNNFSFSVTPKYQSVETILYVERANAADNDDFDADEFTNDDTNFNVDVGVAWYLNENITIGASIKNLIEEEYDTVMATDAAEKDTYELATLITSGIAYQNSWFSAALDVDLTPTKGFASQDDSQYASLGFEFDAANWAQFRLGARVDMESVRDDVVTAGIGLSPFDVFHIGITGIAGENETYGGVLEFKLTL